MSRFKLPSGQIVQSDTPFELSLLTVIPPVYDDEGEETAPARVEMDAIGYPSGVRSLSVPEREQFNIVEIAEQQMPDNRYGFVTESANAPGTWDFNPFPTEMLQDRLIAHAKDKRWVREQGGFEFSGMAIATDDRSQSKILGARVAAIADPDFTTPWAVGETSFDLNAQMIVAISDATLAHVRSAFVIFQAAVTDIRSGAITTYEEIDDAFAA